VAKNVLDHLVEGWIGPSEVNEGMNSSRTLEAEQDAAEMMDRMRKAADRMKDKQVKLSGSTRRKA